MYVHAPLTYIVTRLSDTKNFGKPEPFHHYYPRSPSFPNRNDCARIYHRVIVQDSIGTAIMVGRGVHPHQSVAPRLQSARSALLPIILS